MPPPRGSPPRWWRRTAPSPSSPRPTAIEVIDGLIDVFDTLVLLKVKPLLDQVLDLLERRGLLDQACFVEKVGAPDERVVLTLNRLRGEQVAYLSLLLVRNPRAGPRAPAAGMRRQGRSA